MPFTPAHPLAILPVARWRHLDATCLVFGSMAPDFEYFMHGHQRGHFGHTLLGVALWGVPVTLILAAVFHGVVKWPLVLAAPSWVAKRVAAAAARPWPAKWSVGTIATLVISAALGDLTHIVWDGFTHANGWGERHFPALGDFVAVPVLGNMVVFRVLQYGFSVLGLLVLAWYLLRHLRRTPPIEIPTARRSVPRLVFAIAIAAGVALVMYRALHLLHVRDPGSIVVSFISGVLAGTLVASSIVSVRARQFREAASADKP